MEKIGKSFFKNSEIRVKFNLDCIDDDLYGKLIFCSNKLPVLDIEEHSALMHGQFRLSDQEKKSIHCRDRVKRFTLVNCRVQGSYIYPEYIVEDHEENSIHGIEIALTGLSAWFDQFTHFEFTDTEIKKNIPDNKFDIIVDIGQDQYQFTSNYRCNISNTKKREFLVSEHTTIKIIKVTGSITAKEAEKFAQDMRILFSLLLGYALSFEYTWLLVGEIKTPINFYFCWPGKSEDPFDFVPQCLVHHSFIFKQEKWDDIFQNYYSNKKNHLFKTIWARLPTLFDYKGLWEYEFLGYVSILDAYINFFSKTRKKLNSAQYKNLKKKLLEVTDQFRKQFDDDYNEFFDSFKNGINAIKNTDLPTFKNKFDAFAVALDEDAMAMIGFSEKEFKIVKKIRDKAAHGQPVITDSENDISFEFRVKDKLQVFLLYLVYRDLGFSPVEYATCLYQTLSPWVINAKIDRFQRDKLSGQVPIYEVRESELEKASKYDTYTVVIEFVKGEYRYSIDFTKEVQINWVKTASKKHKNVIDHLKEVTSNVDGIYKIEYISCAYLVYAKQNIRLSSVCLITYNLMR